MNRNGNTSSKDLHKKEKGHIYNWYLNYNDYLLYYNLWSEKLKILNLGKAK